MPNLFYFIFEFYFILNIFLQQVFSFWNALLTYFTFKFTTSTLSYSMFFGDDAMLAVFWMATSNMLGVKLNSLCRSIKNKFTSILFQYNKTEHFRIFRLPCQQKLKLLAKSIKTIKSIIIISIFIIYLSMVHLTC